MMSDIPPITLGDEQDTYDEDEGDFTTYLPVTVRCEDKEQARKAAKIFTQAWQEAHGDE